MNILQVLTEFFNHPFFIIVGGLTTVASLFAVLYTIYLVIKGVLPVWYRLGIGLSTRKITIFAEDEYDDLRNMLVDSKIFQGKNIIKIDKKSIKRANSATLILVHWKPFKKDMEKILRNKKDNAALIIYAPPDEGLIDTKHLKMFNLERNTVIVNFRGRLLNDILTCMITTSYDKR